MDSGLYDFLAGLITGVVGMVDDLFSGVPYAKDAILWMFFVYLVMNLIVLPIRGYGASDRALAKEVRSGRSESTSAVMQSRSQSKALRAEAMQNYHHRNTTQIGPRRRNGRL